MPTASVPVLMYHELSEPGMAAWDHLAVSPAVFGRQLDYLRDADYSTLTAGALASLLAQGRQAPPRTVVLTFDDGFEDFRRHAVPALAARGFTATVFVTTGWVDEAGRAPAAGRPGRMLSWSQAAEAVSAGVEVAAHSCQHPQLDQVPVARARDELIASKAVIEDELGIPVPGLAYPYGYSNTRVREIARAAGYYYAYAVRNIMTSPGSDLFALPRLTIHRSTGLSEFRRLVDGKFAPTMARDRALTASWSVVRRSRAALAAVARHGRVPEP